MEFSKSQKGNDVLLHLGYEYLFYRSVKGIKMWRYRQSRSIKCPFVIRTELDKIVQEPTSHNHDSCPQKAIANSIRKRMRDDRGILTGNPRNVLGGNLVDVNEHVLAHMPKQSSLL